MSMTITFNVWYLSWFIPLSTIFTILHLFLTLVGSGDGAAGSRANYMVVDTDYDTFAIVYSCSPKPLIPVKKGEYFFNQKD